MKHSTQTAAPKMRRPLSDAQKAVQPLAPIFGACKATGLKITPENKIERLRAYNRYVNDVPGLDWISESFKELLGNAFAIEFCASAIRDGALCW